MAEAYCVALVLDPDFGERLREIAEAVHVWAVGTPANRRVAEDLWKRLPQPFEYDIESGITTFDPTLGTDSGSWCQAILRTLDLHHDATSHEPGYTVLSVYGLRWNDGLRPWFTECGFTSFEETSHGFRAVKPKP